MQLGTYAGIHYTGKQQTFGFLLFSTAKIKPLKIDLIKRMDDFSACHLLQVLLIPRGISHKRNAFTKHLSKSLFLYRFLRRYFKYY
jgi:hypothetical protein